MIREEEGGAKKLDRFLFLVIKLLAWQILLSVGKKASVDIFEIFNQFILENSNLERVRRQGLAWQILFCLFFNSEA